MKVFRFYENGDIVDLSATVGELMYLEAVEFWSSLPEAARVALAKTAPRVAGPWREWPERYCVRLDRSSRFAATVSRHADGFQAFAANSILGTFPTAEEARDAADERLRAEGLVLE